jgi:DNA-binding MarR family transcriptional regulator
MRANAKTDNLILKLWFITHRTRDVLRNCEDKVFGRYGLTAEQYAVLAVMEVLGGSVRVTDLARGLGRDRGDRRTVRVSISTKGEAAFRPATVAGLELIGEIMSPLSHEDKRNFLNAHEVIRQKALQYLNPEGDIEEMRKSDVTSRPDLAKRLRQYLTTSTGEG